MTREHWELAKQIYWDTLSRGGMLWKGLCSIAILLSFFASVVALILQVSGDVHVLVFLAATLTGLLVIPSCLCLTRIARTVWNVSAVEAPASALAALQAAPQPKRQKDRIYTKDYAFFFQRGTVLDVGTRRIYIPNGYMVYPVGKRREAASTAWVPRKSRVIIRFCFS